MSEFSTPLSFPLIHEPPSERFLKLLKGAKIKCSPRMPERKPNWLDEERFERGRKVFGDHLVGIAMSNFCMLTIGLCVSPLTKLLCATQCSGEPRAARLRYFDTFFYVWVWYTAPPPWELPEPWNRVIRLHNKAQAKYVKGQIKCEKVSNESLSSEDKWWLEEMRLTRGVARAKGEQFKYYQLFKASDVPLSQFDMALTQMSFCCFVSQTRYFGARLASEEDLLDLAYFWKVAGYYLGLVDEYNIFFTDNLSEIRALMNEIKLRILLPSILLEDENDPDVGPMGTVMAEAVCQGFKLSYMVILYCHFEALLGIHLDRLWQTFSWSYRLKYWTKVVVIEWLFLIPPFRRFVNALVHYAMTFFCRKRLQKFFAV